MSNDRDQAKASAERALAPSETLIAAGDATQPPADPTPQSLAQTPLAAVIDFMPDAAFLYDAEGRIVRTSAAARVLFGFEHDPRFTSLSPAERVRMIAPRRLDGQPLPEEEWHITRLLRGETIPSDAPVTAIITTLDGRERVFSYTGGPIRGPDGEIVGALAIGREITQLHARSRGTHERLDQLEATFSAIADGIITYDAQGHISSMNEAARAILGMDSAPRYASLTLRERARMLRGRLADGHPHPRQDWVAARALRGETLTGSAAVDVIMTALDGREVFVTISGAPIRDAAGEIVGAVAVFHDVTQRRRLEREAAEHAAELATLVETMPDAAALFGPDGAVLLVNTAFRQLFELDHHPDFFEEPVEERRRMLHLIDGDGNALPPGRSPFERVLRDGKRVVGADAMDIVVEAPDGSRSELEVVGSPVHSDEGRILGAVLLYRDVTERRRLERRTRESLDALLQMAETLVASPDQVAHDEAGETTQRKPNSVRKLAELTRRVLSCNRVSIVAVEPDGDLLRPLAIAGLSPEQERDWHLTASGRRLSAYRTPDELAQLHAGKALVIDLASLPDAARWTYGASATLLVPLLVSSQLVGLMTIGYGATPHEYTSEEIALAETAGKLAALVVERERLLAERAEAQAKQLALADANRRMDEFLSIASHELRTPLTSIKANVQLASRQLHQLSTAAQAATSGSRKVAEVVERLEHAEGEPGLAPTPHSPDDHSTEYHAQSLPERLERAERLLERTGRQVRRMDRLVGDLLDVSRIQAGKLELRQELLDLLPIVQDAVQEQRAAWTEREITLDLPDHTSVPIFGDADRIGQVVTNLLTNALKYSPAEQPVAVTLRMHDDCVRVAVRDHGPGLSAEQRQQLFERFYRVPGIQQQSGSGIGLGLGLHICKTIVQRHSGEIDVESAPGRGSTFYFTLPLHPE